MGFVPSYQHSIIPEESFREQITAITQQLAPYRVEGYFNAFDGNRLYYSYFLAENSKASVVIVHGLSEFTEKFIEAAWYFLNQGYNVFVYDQRCHGRSGRLTQHNDLLHVEKFTDYAKDLQIFIDTVVLPADDKPLYIYSHSMGGAVTLLYLQEHGDKIQKAVLSAPLIDPRTVELPRFMIHGAVILGKFFLGGKKKFFTSHDFDPNHPFSRSSDKSKARFDHYLSLRRENPEYQTAPMSYSWTDGCLRLKKKFLSDRFLKKLNTPILLIIAEHDKVVKTEPQYIFAEKYKNCKTVVIKEGNHGMLAGTMETITEHMAQTLRFYAL